ncbi:MAG: FeoA family protein [Planctomycetota bacterium]
MTTLSTLSPGTEALLLEVGGSRPLQCRLMEMGLLPGTRVQLIRHNHVGGVLELKVRQSHLTLRLGEASLMTVTLA